MSEIIRQIFKGNPDILQRPYCAESHETEAFTKMEELTDQMKLRIPPEFHPILEQYQNSMMALMDAACEEEYLSGYQLGVRMMVAAWPGEH